MNKIKKICGLFALLTMVFCFNIISLAAKTDVPDNFYRLSVEQRIQWMDENVPQTTEDAICISKRRIDYTDYTATKENSYKDEVNSKIVGISVTYDWRVNSNFDVETYNVSDFSTYIYNPSFVFLNKDISSFYVTNSNVKVCPEANFASAYMGILVGQNVNLHGEGKISFAEVSQAY